MKDRRLNLRQRQTRYVGHVVAFDLDPHRIDEHQIGDARRVSQRELFGDPATHGVSDDRHILQSAHRATGVERREIATDFNSSGRWVPPNRVRGEETRRSPLAASSFAKHCHRLGARSTVQHEVGTNLRPDRRALPEPVPSLECREFLVVVRLTVPRRTRSPELWRSWPSQQS